MSKTIQAIAVLLVFMLAGVEVNAQTDTKVVVIPMPADDVDTDAVTTEVLNRLVLTTDYQDCVWTACVDSPRYSNCPQGTVMVGIDLPEYGGNEGGCNSNSVTGADDYRLRCCRVRVTVRDANSP